MARIEGQLRYMLPIALLTNHHDMPLAHSPLCVMLKVRISGEEPFP